MASASPMRAGSTQSNGESPSREVAVVPGSCRLSVEDTAPGGDVRLVAPCYSTALVASHNHECMRRPRSTHSPQGASRDAIQPRLVYVSAKGLGHPLEEPCAYRSSARQRSAKPPSADCGTTASTWWR